MERRSVCAAAISDGGWAHVSPRWRRACGSRVSVRIWVVVCEQATGACARHGARTPTPRGRWRWVGACNAGQSTTIRTGRWRHAAPQCPHALSLGGAHSCVRHRSSIMMRAGGDEARRVRALWFVGHRRARRASPVTAVAAQRVGPPRRRRRCPRAQCQASGLAPAAAGLVLVAAHPRDAGVGAQSQFWLCWTPHFFFLEPAGRGNQKRLSTKVVVQEFCSAVVIRF